MMNKKIPIILLLLHASFETFAQKETTTTFKDSIHTVVDLPAKFPGGNTAWNRYFERNFNVGLDSTQISSTLIASFIVHKDGRLSDITIQNFKQKINTLEAAYIKLLNDGPRWIPAIKNGKKVNSKISWPITICTTEE